MAHLDLLSRSRRSAACVPSDIYCPLGTPGPAIIHLLPVTLARPWRVVGQGPRGLACPTSRFASAPLRDARHECASRGRTILSRHGNRLPAGDTTRPLSPYRHRRTWRRRLHTSTGSFPLEQILEPSFLPRSGSQCLPRYPLVSSASLSGDVFYSVCIP